MPLVDDSSRVARDLRDALYVLRELKFLGIRTVYISQQIDSEDEQAETLLTVHGLFDGLYLREMSKKIRRGIGGQFDRGFHTGGRTYGYRSVPVYDPTGKHDADGPIVVGKRREIDPEQARVVRQIFEWYLRQQLQDLSGLLADDPSRAKVELQRLNVQFTVTPVRDEGKPFLRVEGMGDLETLCGLRDLPSTARSPDGLPRSGRGPTNPIDQLSCESYSA